MKILISLVFSIAISLFLICCSKNEQTLKFDLKVTPIFLKNDKFKSLFKDSLSEYVKAPFSTFDAQFDDHTNQMTAKLINLRATNYKDESSRFQIVQYDDDFNGNYNDSSDKIFVNFFNNQYLHTIDNDDFISYQDEFIIQISYFYYCVKFLNPDKLLIKRVEKQEADLIFDDRVPNVKVEDLNENVINFYDLISEGDSYVYHMAYDCKPCLMSIPEINKFKEENPNINIFGLVTRNKERQHLDKLNKLAKNWKVFGISTSGKNHQNTFKALPEMILIDNQGYFLSKNTWIGK